MEILFAHGAGASSQSEWMTRWQERLSCIAPTHRFDYPYMKAKKRLPNRLPQLIEAHEEALRRLPQKGEVVLAGKSMGSRVGCHLSLQVQVSALVCFGFPLVSISGKSRAQVLKQLGTPVLFVTGSRDKLCPLKELERVREEMSAPSQIYVVEGGNHSLLVGKRALKTAGETQKTVDDRIQASVREFLSAS